MPTGASAELEIPYVAAVSVAYAEEDSEDDTGSAHSAVAAAAAAGACGIDGDSAAGTQTCLLSSPSVVCAPDAFQRVHAL